MARRPSRLLRLSMAVSLVVLQLLLLTGSEATAGVVLTVNSTGDASDAVPGDGICDTGVRTPASNSQCTLRAAIEEANQPGPVRNIIFSIATGSAIPIIRPASPLPQVTRRVEIDATTQSGSAGVPRVIIDGSMATAGNGLDIDANDSVIRGLVIHGFDGAGLVVRGDRNTIVGNFIGVDGGGGAARGNDQGVVIHGSRNVIGGSSPKDRNIISGNQGAGISVSGAERTEVVGNHIGLEATGIEAVANQGSGVEVVAGSDRTTVGPGNVIGGNSSNGIHVFAGTTRTRIIGNRVGTNADGSSPVGNGLSGIDVEAGQILISDNQISGNRSHGIQINHGSAVVHGNWVGTNAEGTGPVSNGGNGIHLNEGATGSEIGGAHQGAGNVIAYNDGAGVALVGDQRLHAALVSNSIFSNGGIGIDLSGPGPTANDPGDTDAGPNDVLNYPTITRAVESDGRVEVHFELDAPTGSYRVEFFLNPSGADPSGFGEGETPVSFLTVRRTSETGEFNKTIVANSGDILTATASRCSNPSCTGLLFTSEFSPAVTILTANRAPTLTEIPDGTTDEGTTLSFTATALDPDPGDTLTFSLVDAPVGASIDSRTGAFNWTPTEGQGPGSHTFAVFVSDDGAPRLTDSQTVTITVAEVNQAPRIVSPGDQSNQSGETVDLAIIATDPDLPANTINFKATGLPPGLAIEPDTGRISGTVQGTASVSSPHTVTVIVTDDGIPGLSDHIAFAWNIEHTNRPPSLDRISDKTVAEQTPLSFTATARDEDNDTLTFGLLDGPPGASIDAESGVFAWTPNEAQGPGTYTFGITVTDAGTPRLSDVRMVTITVTELNQAPVAFDDSARTDEDRPVIVDVLANDRDPDAPANILRIGSVTQPSQGVVTIVENQILYAPSPNFNGADSFTYTVGDGLEVATGSVLISVTAVNDPPIARFDRFHPDSFRQTALDVLSNDLEADNDPLTVEIVSKPERGTAWVEDSQIVYRPENGWTGTTRFRYVISDPSGESSQATVEVVVGQHVLVAAQNLARRLGVEVLAFQASSSSDEKGSFSVVDLDAVTLLAKSFLRTADSLKVPLGLLGLAVAITSGLRRSSEIPPLVYGRGRRHWSAVRLSRQERLSAYAEPGGEKVVYSYEPTATGIVGTGRSRRVGGARWLQVETPKGTAWIQQHHLTEQRDLEAFSEDQRPVRLLHELAQLLHRGDSLSRVSGSRGLMVALSGSIYRLTPELIDDLTSRPRHRHRSGSDPLPMPPGRFSASVAKPLLDAYEDTPSPRAALPSSLSGEIPTEFLNLHCLTLGREGAAQLWLVFFEYQNGKATIAALATIEPLAFTEFR